MSKAELAYLRHKAYTLSYHKYHTINARAVPQNDLFGTTLYMYMGGMEVDTVLAILAACRPKYR